MMPQETAYVAVDVSKASLEIGCYGERRTWRAANAASGWAKLIGGLGRLGRPAVVGVEPSGGYERGVVEALLRAPGFGAGHGPLDHGWPLRGRA